MGNKSIQKKINALAYIKNEMTSLRAQYGNFLGISHDGNRDIYDIYGYDRELSYSNFWDMATESGIANRITHGVAKSCWRDGFEVYRDADDAAATVLTDELALLKKAGLNKKIEQADILNRIGRFSVLFVGVPDGLEPSQPVGNVSANKLKQVYFKAYGYDSIEIKSQVDDPKNPRYGLPEIYEVKQEPRKNQTKDASKRKPILVHYSRIVHLSEASLVSDIEGASQLEPIFKRLRDLDKATGGSAEAYFRNARGKMAYEIDPKFSDSLVSGTAKDAFDTSAKEFTNGWKDFVVALGAKVQGIDTPHHSPLDTVKVILWEISGYSGIPIRILTGEGAGQLAGSEDQLAYNAIIAGRQVSNCSGWIVAVLEILSAAGMLSFDDGYDVRFPVQAAVTETQAADIAKTQADTIKAIAEAASTLGGDEIDTVQTLKGLGIDVVIDTSLEDLTDEN